MARVLIGNFKGPKGDKGDKGDRGPQGPQGPQGPVGLVNADAAVEFEDYTGEGVEIPTAEAALAEIVSGKSLKSILSNIRAFLKKGVAVPEVIGDRFLDEKDYTAGDYTIKGNMLYRFITDKAAGKWDETAVLPTTVSAEFQEVKAKMEKMTRLSLSDTSNSFAPWNVIKQNWNKIPYRIVSGTIKSGYTYIFEGYKADNDYGCFLVYSYNGPSYFVRRYNTDWIYGVIPVEGETQF